jgi:hypothetical protein
MRVFDLEIVVGDEGLDTEFGCERANLACEFARIGTDPGDGESKLVRRDSCGGHHMRRIAEDEDALAGQVGRVDRARIPGHPGRGRERSESSIPASAATSAMKSRRRAHADRHGLRAGLAEGALQPLRGRGRDLGVEDHVEVGLAEARQIGRRGAERCDGAHLDAQLLEQGA